MILTTIRILEFLVLL